MPVMLSKVGEKYPLINRRNEKVLHKENALKSASTLLKRPMGKYRFNLR